MHDFRQGRCGDRRANRFGNRFEAFAREMGEQIGEQFAGGGRGRGGPRGGGPGGGPGGFGGGFDGGPRGRRRVFDGAELRLVLLKLVEDQPRHGYELIKAIEALSGGVYAPSPGMVYPTLTLIADEGLVDEVPEGARKRFAITDAGRKVLADAAETVAGAMARLEALAKMSERTDSAPVRRAMRNLHMALHARLAQDGTDREAQLQIAAILDEAASKVERL